jgi:hypothetical protein
LEEVPAWGAKNGGQSSFGGREKVLADALYKLGILAKEMLDLVPSPASNSSPACEELRKRIFVLLSDNMHERLEIYNLLDDKNREMDKS